jgi:drug/metabolite transporter (DMT)-like permease
MALSTSPSTSAPQLPAASARRRSTIIVASCTLLGAAAQILIKLGMGPGHFVPTLMGLLTDFPLICGYALYGLFTIAMVLALREGELSMMYPIIALTYVWVTLLSYWLLKETPNFYKNMGIVTIVVGVAVLGRGGRK